MTTIAINLPDEQARLLQKPARKMKISVEALALLGVRDLLTTPDEKRILDIIDRLEAIEGIRQGLEDVKHGRTQPAKDALEEIGKKHNLLEN